NGLDVIAIEYNASNLPRARKCIDIFVDKNDVTHMVFSEEHGDVYYMSGFPGNWSTPELVAPKGHISIYPEIVTLDNNIFIAFEDGESHELFFISRIDGVWQPLENLGPGMLPTLKIGSNGMVYLLYRFWDGKDLKYNAVFAYIVPYFTGWTFMGEIHVDTTNPLPEITHVERRLEHGPHMTVGIDGNIYMAWPHRTPGVDSPSPYKCQLFCARAKEPGIVWDVKYGKDDQLFYQDTGSPYPRVEVYSDSTILYYNSRRIGPYFLINKDGKWSDKRTTSPAELWTMGITQVANDGNTIWVLSSTWGDVKGSVDVTGLTNPEASQFNWSNNDPIITTTPDTIAIIGKKWSYVCGSNDADGDNLTYSFTLAPDSMKINKYTGEIEWNVSEQSEPVSLIGIKVDDGRGGHASQWFNLRINPPEAGFTAEPRTGYAPLTVQFTDVSGGTVTQWLWDFGDGSTSTEQNPQHVYQNPGTYSVSLKVTSASGSSSTEEPSYITVLYPPPVADFSAEPVSGLKPLTVNFKDKSTGDIETFYWVFGDGASSTEQNPVHTYNLSGQYSVALTVTGQGGSNTKSREAYIHVADSPPVADFSYYPQKGEKPLTVNFTDKSSGVVASYLWYFGDGDSSTVKSPEHTYDSTGVFSVSLTVANAGGSSTKTIDSAVVVTPPLPVPDFEGTPRNGPAPLSVQFTNKTTGVADSCTWDFGDGTKITGQDPVHVYDKIGYYTVRLTAWRAGESNSETKENYITVLSKNPTADFSAEPLKGKAPLTVKFTDQSLGNVSSWRWKFGNGDGAFEKDPEYTYSKSGNFTVSLTVMGPGGIDSLVKRNYIHVTEPPPVAAFSADTTKGYKPLTVHFFDESQGTVTSWLWNFGDGGESTEQNPEHTYTDEGVFSVMLKVSGPGGTDSTVSEAYISVSVDMSIEKNNSVHPEKYFLNQNYPNPFNSETVISWFLPEKGEVSISVYDVRGNRVVDLFNGFAEQGSHRSVWKGKGRDSSEVPAGIYIIQMKTKHGTKMIKAAFVK
ncbi:hypothetical protein DRQ07_07595, partial [candidate division KSB1 bacterium]